MDDGVGTGSLLLGPPNDPSTDWRKALKDRLPRLCFLGLTLAICAHMTMATSIGISVPISSAQTRDVRLMQVSKFSPQRWKAHQELPRGKRPILKALPSKAQVVRTSTAQLPPIKVSKVALDGTKGEYLLDSVLEEPHVVVAKMVATEKQNYGLQVGSVSWGVWPLGDSPFWGAAKINGPDGQTLCYRVFALDNTKFLEIEEGRKVLEFRDLFLGAVFDKDSLKESTVKNTDKVEGALDAKLLSRDQFAKISRFRDMVEFEPDTILRYIDEAVTNASRVESLREPEKEVNIPLPNLDFDDDQS